ncbi:MAG: DMT family protein [Planctomycetes bacterium]|nr:DMT family protein [Planctomycetota bacterium]
MKAIPILLLCASNLFMTAAWYGHLKHKGAALWLVILVSWCIALPEYALQVPANRIGSGSFSVAQLKIIQEAISITVFVGFSLWYFKQAPRWPEIAGFALIFAGVAVAMIGRPAGFEVK